MKQYQSEQINELTTALSKAQALIEHAQKLSDNPYYKSKYADLPSVIDAAKKHLASNGLSVVQMPDIEGESVFLVTQLNHSSGQWMRSYYPVKPIKNDPQGFGSAITYARRYAYSCMVGVASADEDDDGNSASNLTVATENKNKSIFKNAALRKGYHESIQKGINECETLSQLHEYWVASYPKIRECTNNGEEWDVAMAEELTKIKNVKKQQLEQDGLLNEFAERKI